MTEIDVSAYRDETGSCERSVYELLDDFVYRVEGGLDGCYTRTDPFQAHPLTREIIQLIKAAETGDMWEAVLRALWVGKCATQEELYFPAMDRIHTMKPDAETGQKVRGGGKKGGGERSVETRFGVSPVEIENAVLDFCPDHSWTKACDRVAERVGCSGRTVRRLTKSVQWSSMKRNS
jgi:hypothetical protein